MPRVAHVQGPSWDHPWLMDLVTRLPARGWRPVVVTLQQRGPLHAACDRVGVPSLALGGWRPWERPRTIARLARVLRGVNVAHAHLFDAELASVCAGAIAHRPVVITQHASPELTELAPITETRRAVHRLVDRLVLQRAAAVIAPSGRVRVGLIRLGVSPSRIRHILLGVDIDRLRAVDFDQAARLRREFAPRSSFVAITVGRLSWEKRVDSIVRAWPRVRSEIPDALLLIAGDGPKRPGLEDLATRLDVSASITFLGWRPDVRELVASADVVICASATESTGLALIEALAVERPLVTTPVGIVNEYLVPNEHCIVVPHADPDRIAAALASVATDRARATEMGRAGSVAVARESGIERTADAYASLYSEIATRLSS